MKQPPKHFHRHYRSPVKRGVFAFLIVFSALTFGTVGLHCLENMSWLDAFYFMSMIATSQGPTLSPHTAAGKLFASFMAFVSVGSVAASLGFIFGPFLGRLWRVHLEEDLPLKSKEKVFGNEHEQSPKK